MAQILTESKQPVSDPRIIAVQKLRDLVKSQKKKQIVINRELGIALLTLLDDMAQYVQGGIDDIMDHYDKDDENTRLMDDEEAAYEAACAVDGHLVDWETFYTD